MGAQRKKSSAKIIIFFISLLVIAGLIFAGYIYLNSSSKEDTSKKKKNAEIKDRQARQSNTEKHEKTDINTYKNNRFNFRVDYPINWQAEEAQNGDGVKLTSPSEKNLLVRVYGYNNVMQDSLSKIAADQESWKKQEHSDFEVIENKNVNVDSLPAIETIWEYSAWPSESPIQGKITHQGFALLKDGVVYNLEMQVSKETFDQYRIVFENLVDSFKVN